MTAGGNGESEEVKYKNMWDRRRKNMVKSRSPSKMRKSKIMSNIRSKIRRLYKIRKLENCTKIPSSKIRISIVSV